jgi:hypothetical protein
MRQFSSDAYELTDSGFCLNADRHGPGAAHSYGLGVLSGRLRSKRTTGGDQAQAPAFGRGPHDLQQYVWVYSEGNELIDSDWTAIANLK